MHRMQTLSGRNARRLGKHGKVMKDETGQHGGDSGGQTGGQSGNDGGNNQGGNSGGQGGSGGSQNNGGQSFDPNAFWREPSPEASQSPSQGGSAGSGESGGGQQQNEGNAFAERLNNLAFAKEVFTPDAIKSMNEGGDPKAFNENMTTFGRQAVRESVVMAAQLMQKNNSMLETRFQEMLDERFGQRDAEGDLGKEFPSYSQPGMKPMIDGIFAQAMRVTKGKRADAVAMTKEMLLHTTKSMSTDLGLNIPPGGAGDGLGPQTNWEEELLGR